LALFAAVTADSNWDLRLVSSAFFWAIFAVFSAILALHIFSTNSHLIDSGASVGSSVGVRVGGSDGVFVGVGVGEYVGANVGE